MKACSTLGWLFTCGTTRGFMKDDLAYCQHQKGLELGRKPINYGQNLEDILTNDDMEHEALFQGAWRLFL